MGSESDLANQILIRLFFDGPDDPYCMSVLGITVNYNTYKINRIINQQFCKNHLYLEKGFQQI